MSYERGQYVVTSIGEGITVATVAAAVEEARESVASLGQPIYILQVVGIVRPVVEVDLGEGAPSPEPKKRHPVSHPGTCGTCHQDFRSQQGLSRHRKIAHQHPCVDCRTWCDSIEALREHRIAAHPSAEMVVPLMRVEDVAVGTNESVAVPA